jgi:hypothetical protein
VAADGSASPAEEQEQAAEGVEDAMLDEATAVTDADLPVEEACAEAGTAADAPAGLAAQQGAADAAIATSSSSKQQQAALRTVNLRKLLLNVLLLRHLAYRCHNTQAALVAGGLVSTTTHADSLPSYDSSLFMRLVYAHHA